MYINSLTQSMDHNQPLDCSHQETTDHCFVTGLLTKKTIKHLCKGQCLSHTFIMYTSVSIQKIGSAELSNSNQSDFTYCSQKWGNGLVAVGWLCCTALTENSHFGRWDETASWNSQWLHLVSLHAELDTTMPVCSSFFFLYDGLFFCFFPLKATCIFDILFILKVKKTW